MKTTLIVFVLALASSLFYNLYLREDNKQNVVPDLTALNPVENDNKAEFIAGCKVFEGPNPPEVVYPSRKQNFLALTCALEVPPPLEVVLMQKEDNKASKK